MTEQFSKEVLKTIPESAVVDEVKKIIKATGLKVQRINTGCFQIGAGKIRRENVRSGRHGGYVG